MNNLHVDNSFCPAQHLSRLKRLAQKCDLFYHAYFENRWGKEWDHLQEFNLKQEKKSKQTKIDLKFDFIL